MPTYTFSPIDYIIWDTENKKIKIDAIDVTVELLFDKVEFEDGRLELLKTREIGNFEFTIQAENFDLVELVKLYGDKGVMVSVYYWNGSFELKCGTPKIKLTEPFPSCISKILPFRFEENDVLLVFDPASSS